MVSIDSQLKQLRKYILYSSYYAVFQLSLIPDINYKNKDNKTPHNFKFCIEKIYERERERER